MARRIVRRHVATRSAAFIALLSFFVLADRQLRATNDENHIQEIMAGANGNSRIQFVVVKQEGSGNLWGPQFGETQSRVMLQFFDATGREIGKFKFPHDVPPDANPQLIATQEFADLPGAPTPDFIMPPLLSLNSGKVCFTNNPLGSQGFPRTDCVSYGSFTGATGTDTGSLCSGPVVDGPPAPALPITNTVSLKRTNACGSINNAGFVINNVPTPTNDALLTFTIPVASQVVQGENLFNKETFDGNGRTCASCHIANLSLRFTPANAQSRFATLGTTFDPQFIGETAPSSFDAGFDFNLNTLVLTTAVPSASPCSGTLRGIITAGGGAKAKVLSQISPTTYLVYGGMNPALAGAVSDSNSCSGTVSTITAGSVGAITGSGVFGLEEPLRMRSSRSADFPQGRALILENIDGFPPTPPVFRKSPHLLNLSRTGPFGFGGDIPDLQTFATGAVKQHFPRTLARLETGSNPDFRLPTAEEKAAMEAFMQAQEFPPGNDPDKFNLDRFALTPQQQAGRAAFFGATAKCSQCHGGTVLSLTTVPILDQPAGINAVFNTGVVNQIVNSNQPGGDSLPCENDPIIGTCGSRKFSVPQLFNVRNLGPFFHDASAATLQQAVEFYNGSFFNTSPAGVAIGGIALTPQMTSDIVAFLEGLSLGTISPNSSTTLTGTVGNPVAPAPSVLVLEADGAPAIGVQVTFAITAGAGNLTGATPTTNGSGIATVGSWTLGNGTNTLTASVTGDFVGNPVTFNATVPPPTPNDNFVNRFTLTGFSPTTTGSNAAFTQEVGEPTDGIFDFGSGTHAGAWWTWTAPCTFSVTEPTSFIDTIGSSFDTVLGVFTGSSLNALTLVAGDDQSGGSNTSRIPSFFTGPTTLNITAGTVFQIRVRGFFSSTGSIALNIHGPTCGTAPTITPISDQVVAEDTPTSAIPFTVDDAESGAGSLVMTGSSSNTTLVPNSNIIFGGSGASRTVTVTPQANQFGTVNITATVTDGLFTTDEVFQVTVNAVNDAPTITAIANRGTNKNTSTSAIPFTVGDSETAAGSLVVTAVSSNQTLVPDASLFLGGTNTSRNIVAVPANNQLGTTTITVTVSDGTLTANSVFDLKVIDFSASPTALKFKGRKAGAGSATLTSVTPAQTVTVGVTGPSTAWNAISDQPWAIVTNGSGTGSGSFTIGIANPGNVLNGATDVNANVTITPTTAGLAAIVVQANLKMDLSGGATTAPFGQVDTPAQNVSGVVGTIGMTGWVLDDVGVAGVQIFRNCLNFEQSAVPTPCLIVNGNNVVFVGDAAFLPGARPDVEAAFPTFPRGNIGGWGFLILTNMMPHVPTAQTFGGQGTVTLFAFATDMEGNRVLLGRAAQTDFTPTTMTLANDGIAGPFGAIDTPGQGVTVSGTLPNFGWSLTPDLDSVADVTDILIPTNGSTSFVFIDGLAVAAVNSNNCRGLVGPTVPPGQFCDDDVANIFGNPTPQPTFTIRNSNPTRFRNLDAGRAAIGVHVIDTTLMTNGLHTIAWSITDSAARVTGIGSRFFIVLNGSSLTTEELAAAPAQALADASAIAGWPEGGGDVWGRRGFDLTTPWEAVAADGDGVRRVTIPDLGRLELWLGETPVTAGYLQANGELRALPPGSQLDSATGHFTWMPGPGYFGAYDLVFLRSDGTQLPLRVTIGSLLDGPGLLRGNVDLPGPGATVSGAFTVAGWAADQGAWQGSGIAAVHVWAQRRDVPAAEAEFLGAADVGGLRPDVGAAFGRQFDRSGWTLTTAGLAPGRYEITAYFWSTRTQQFEDARTVTVTVR